MERLIMFDDIVIGTAITNARMTYEEICACAGIELARTEEEHNNSPENGLYILEDLTFVVNMTGKSWGELSSYRQEELLENATAIDGATGEEMRRDGECIIDLIYPFAIQGRVSTKNDECVIEIDDNSTIYNSLG